MCSSWGWHVSRYHCRSHPQLLASALPPCREWRLLSVWGDPRNTFHHGQAETRGGCSPFQNLALGIWPVWCRGWHRLREASWWGMPHNPILFHHSVASYSKTWPWGGIRAVEESVAKSCSAQACHQISGQALGLQRHMSPGLGFRSPVQSSLLMSGNHTCYKYCSILFYLMENLYELRGLTCEQRSSVVLMVPNSFCVRSRKGAVVDKLRLAGVWPEQYRCFLLDSAHIKIPAQQRQLVQEKKSVNFPLMHFGGSYWWWHPNPAGQVGTENGCRDALKPASTSIHLLTTYHGEGSRQH